MGTAILLPEVTPNELDHLADEHRAALANYWLRRARAEREVGIAFQYLREALAQNADEVVVDMLKVAAEDEARHAGLCEELASRYAGRAVEPPPPRPLQTPTYEGVAPELMPTLHLVGQCAINETLATVWLRQCLDISRTQVARAANRAHLREEMMHARIGWAHLASAAMTKEARAAISGALEAMLRPSVLHFCEGDVDVHDEGYPDEGVPSREASRNVVIIAVRDVILPGFARAGIDTTGAKRWFAAELDCA